MASDSTRALLLLTLLCLLLLKSAVCLSNDPLGIRLNKVFTATHSRRQADALIAAGRVAVNGDVVHDMGRRVVPYVDEVVLDGKQWTQWETRVVKDNNRPIAATASSRRSETQQQQEEYIKFWKPVGVTSTTDRKVVGNLLDALEGKYYPGRPKRTKRQQQQQPIRHRIFSVGRLDKDSSGLLLLTSDGRIPDAVLRKQWKQPKVYQVTIDRPLQSDRHLQQLRTGLVITTDTLRGGRHTSVTAPTLPCQVEFTDDDNSTDTNKKRTTLTVTLTEGRNRQIRVMFQTLGYHVVGLHRTHMLGGIGLDGLRGPGDWKRLTRDELQWLDRAVQRTSAVG